MKRYIELYLADILESIEIIESRVEGLSESELRLNNEKHESIIYRLATIGESVNKLPKDIFDKYSEIDWTGIISMRNILIHKYYEVDLNIVWDTIAKDLKRLKKVVKEIQEESNFTPQLKEEIEQTKDDVNNGKIPILRTENDVDNFFDSIDDDS